MDAVTIWGYWVGTEGPNCSSLHVSEVPSRARASQASKRRKVIERCDTDDDEEEVFAEETAGEASPVQQQQEEEWPPVKRCIRVWTKGVFCCKLFEQQLEIVRKDAEGHGPLLKGQHGTRLNASEWANVLEHAHECLGQDAADLPELQGIGLPETQEARVRLAQALLAHQAAFSARDLLLLVLPEEFFTLCRYGDATQVVPFLAHLLEEMIHREQEYQHRGCGALRQIVEQIAEMALTVRKQPLTILCASSPHPTLHVMRASHRGLAELNLRLKPATMTVLSDWDAVHVIKRVNAALASPRLWVFWDANPKVAHMSLLRYLEETEATVVRARRWVAGDKLDAWVREHGRADGLGATMASALCATCSCPEPVLYTFMRTVMDVGSRLAANRLSLFVPSVRGGESELGWCVKNSRIVCCPVSPFAASLHVAFMEGLRQFPTLTMLAPCEAFAAQLRDLFPLAGVHVAQQVNFLKRETSRGQNPRQGRDRARFMEVLANPFGVDRMAAARRGGVWSGSAGRETNLVVPVARDAREGSEWLVVPRQAVLVVWHADLLGLVWWNFFLDALFGNTSVTVILVGTPVQAAGPLCTDVQGPFPDLCLLAAHMQQLAARENRRLPRNAKVVNEVDPTRPMSAEDMRVACVALAAGLEGTRDMPLRPSKRLQFVMNAGEAGSRTPRRRSQKREPLARKPRPLASVMEDEEQTMNGYEVEPFRFGDSGSSGMIESLEYSMESSASLSDGFFSPASSSAPAFSRAGASNNPGASSSSSPEARSGRRAFNAAVVPPAVVLAMGGAHTLEEDAGRGLVVVQAGHVRVAAVRRMEDAAGVLENDVLGPALHALSVQAVTSGFRAAKELNTSWADIVRPLEGVREGHADGVPCYLSESMDCMRVAPEDAGTEESIRRKVRDARDRQKTMSALRRHAPYPTLDMETGYWVQDKEGHVLPHVAPVAMPAFPEGIRKQCVVPIEDFVGTRDVIVLLCPRGTADAEVRNMLLRAASMAQLHVVLVCDNPGVLCNMEHMRHPTPQFPYLPSMLGIMKALPGEAPAAAREGGQESKGEASNGVKEEPMAVDGGSAEGSSAGHAQEAEIARWRRRRGAL